MIKWFKFWWYRKERLAVLKEMRTSVDPKRIFELIKRYEELQ